MSEGGLDEIEWGPRGRGRGKRVHVSYVSRDIEALSTLPDYVFRRSVALFSGALREAAAT